MGITKYKIAIILPLIILIQSAHAIVDGQKFKDWHSKCIKIQKQNICGITQTIFDTNKKPVVNIFIRRVKGQKQPIAYVKVPLGVNLLAGLGLAVDKKEIAQTPYSMCDPAGCNAIFPITEEASNKMKKGNKFQIGILLENQEIIMQGSLSGFKQASRHL